MIDLLIWFNDFAASLSANVVVLAASILTAAALIARAIRRHTDTLTLRHLGIAPTLTDTTWRIAVEQLLADLLHDEIDIAAFSGMNGGRNAWIRFVARDGRAYVFALMRRVRDCHGWGRRINFRQHPQAADELHALWRYFMTSTGQSGPIPRNAAWYLLPAQTPQHKARPILRIAASTGDGGR